jgi:uncharacterized protein with PQ loop repeat
MFLSRAIKFRFRPRLPISFSTHANPNKNAPLHPQDDDDQDTPPHTQFSAASLPFFTALAPLKPLAPLAPLAPLTPLATSATALSPLVTQFLQVFPPLAAQLVFLAPMQAMKQFKKDGSVGDVAPIPYTAMCINGIVWMSYGALQGEPTIWAPNISAFLFGAYYVHTYSKYTTRNMMPQYAAIGAFGAGAGALCVGLPEQAGSIIGHLGIGIVAVMFGGPLASIKTVLEDKNTKSLPFAFTVASLVNCVAWSSFGLFVIDDYIVWLPNMLGLGAACAQLALFAKFGIYDPTKEEVGKVEDKVEGKKEE